MLFTSVKNTKRTDTENVSNISSVGLSIPIKNFIVNYNLKSLSSNHFKCLTQQLTYNYELYVSTAQDAGK